MHLEELEKQEYIVKKFIPALLISLFITGILMAGDYGVQVWDHELKWIEMTGFYSRYSWKVKLRNDTGDEKRVYIKFELLSGDDFVLHWTNSFVKLRPWKSKWFSGTGMMKTSLAKQVERTNVKISIK